MITKDHEIPSPFSAKDGGRQHQGCCKHLCWSEIIEFTDELTIITATERNAHGWHMVGQATIQQRVHGSPIATVWWCNMAGGCQFSGLGGIDTWNWTFPASSLDGVGFRWCHSLGVGPADLFCGGPSWKPGLGKESGSKVVFFLFFCEAFSNLGNIPFSSVVASYAMTGRYLSYHSSMSWLFCFSLYYLRQQFLIWHTIGVTPLSLMSVASSHC